MSTHDRTVMLYIHKSRGEKIMVFHNGKMSVGTVGHMRYGENVELATKEGVEVICLSNITNIEPCHSAPRNAA